MTTPHEIDSVSASENAPTPSLSSTSASVSTSVTSTSTTSNMGSSAAVTTSTSPPPGLPAPTASKPLTPSAKSATATRAARYKSLDQPVIMPSGSSVPPFAYPGVGASGGSQQLSFGGNYSFDRFGVQFGSLNMNEDSEASIKEPTPEPAPDAVPSAAAQQTPHQSPVQAHQQQAAQVAQGQSQGQSQGQQAQPPSQTQTQQHENNQLPSSLPSQLTQQPQPSQQQPQPPLHQQQQQASVASLYQQASYQQPSGHHPGAQAAPYSIPPSLPHHQSQPQQTQPQPAQHAGYTQQHIQAAQTQQQHAIDSRLGHPSAHTSYYRGPEQTYYGSPNAPPSSQPPQQQDLTSPYGEFSPLSQTHASHLGGFNTSAGPVDYLYGDQQRGASAFQGRNGSISHDDLNKGLLPSQLQTNSGLQQQSTPAQAQGQNGPPLTPGQGAQPPPTGQGQPGYPGMPPISYYYPQPYSQTPYYGQYGAYPPPQPQYMKYQAVYHNAPGSSPAPPQQQPNKPPPSAVAPVNSPYGSAQSQHLYHPSQTQSYEEYGQSNASVVDPYGKQQAQQQQLYGAQNIGSFLGLPGGVPGAGAGSSPGGQQQSTNQQQRGGSGSSPENVYKPYGTTSAGASNGAGTQDKAQQGQQTQASRGNVTAPGVGGPQVQAQVQQTGTAYFPNRYFAATSANWCSVLWPP
ncbi:hypothetical protein BS47DRAFT_960848 [Hydnum rufescens UP504]|uniref:Uncharacterized protein n=1 Tax=Hydnum rufescens UP504 TaxID=1448309 RepID=A0A9P6AWZ2_9AGAM|nr:hypothetical protein BS47DRAFT_960848 [Hydnum rufescens UP504]